MIREQDLPANNSCPLFFHKTESGKQQHPGRPVARQLTDCLSGLGSNPGPLNPEWLCSKIFLLRISSLFSSKKEIINSANFLLKSGQFLCQMFIFTGFFHITMGWGGGDQNTSTKPAISKLQHQDSLRKAQLWPNFPGSLTNSTLERAKLTRE